MKKLIIALLSVSIITAVSSCGTADENKDTGNSDAVQSGIVMMTGSNENSNTDELSETEGENGISEEISETKESDHSSAEENTVYLSSADFPEDSWEYTVLRDSELIASEKYTETISLHYPEKIAELLMKDENYNNDNLKAFYDSEYPDGKEVKVKKLTVISANNEKEAENISDELSELYSAISEMNGITDTDVIFAVDELQEIRIDYDFNGEESYNYLNMAKIDNRWIIRYSSRKMYEEEFNQPEVTGMAD